MRVNFTTSDQIGVSGHVNVVDRRDAADAISRQIARKLNAARCEINLSGHSDTTVTYALTVLGRPNSSGSRPIIASGSVYVEREA